MNDYNKPKKEYNKDNGLNDVFIVIFIIIPILLLIFGFKAIFSSLLSVFDVLKTIFIDLGKIG